MGLLRSLSDLCLDRFRWYRRWRGGTWYETIDLPHGPGPFHVWWHNRRPSCHHYLLSTEHYESPPRG